MPFSFCGLCKQHHPSGEECDCKELRVATKHLPHFLPCKRCGTRYQLGFLCPNCGDPKSGFLKGQGADPKATASSSKTRLDLIPPAASKACADAFAFGAITKGYGTWNWRKSEGVALSVYVAAAKRHLDALMDGEDCAPDSGIHHAGHVMAGMAIVLDALKHGKLIDDRPPVSKEAKS